jgi:hypothetical protein
VVCRRKRMSVRHILYHLDYGSVKPNASKLVTYSALHKNPDGMGVSGLCPEGPSRGQPSLSEWPMFADRISIKALL